MTKLLFGKIGFIPEPTPAFLFAVASLVVGGVMRKKAKTA